MNLNSSTPKKHFSPNNTTYTFLFIFTLCLFTGFLLSIVVSWLQPIQKKSDVFDKNKELLISTKRLNYSNVFEIFHENSWFPAFFSHQEKILKPFPKTAEIKPAPKEDITEFFSLFIRPTLTNLQGDIFSLEEKNMTLQQFVNKYETNNYSDELFPFYVLLKNSEKSSTLTNTQITSHIDLIEALIIPISGFGLWGPLFGFLAIENDGDTVLGSTWYQQAETPGLGANITLPQWQKQFYGKKIFSVSPDGTQNFQQGLLGLDVIKGSVKTILSNSPKAENSIDGISGATLTCNGVTAAFSSSLEPYRQLFIKMHNLNSITNK